MKKIVIALTALLVCAASSAQTVLLDNYTGEFVKSVKSSNVIPNWSVNALYLDGDVLYCGQGPFIHAIDVSSPLEPRLLSTASAAGMVRQITVQNGYLFAACREAGVYFFDVSNPKNIKTMLRYDPVELATGMEVAGDVMFLGTRQNGVEFVDISDVYHPKHIRMEKTDESQSVTYKDGYLYSGEWSGHKISVFDAHDMSKVKLIRTVDLQGFGDGVWTYGNYLYASTGHHLSDLSYSFADRKGNGHGLEIFDISKPDKPKFISKIGFDTLYWLNNDYWTPRPFSDGKYVACADAANGIYIVDARKPKTLSTLSRVDFRRKDGGKVAVTSCAVGNGVIYASVFSELGLVMLECPDAKPCVKEKGVLPINATYRYPYKTESFSHFNAWKPATDAPVRGVAANGKIMYAACSFGGLEILRMKEDGNVEKIGVGPMPYAGDVKVCDGKLYVAEGTDGFAVYQIEGDTQLRELGRYNEFAKRLGATPACVWIFVPDSKHVVASCRFGGYNYFDVSDPSKIKFLASREGGPGWDKYVCDKADSKGWYPRVRHSEAIFWVNMNDDSVTQKKDAGIVPQLTDGVCLFKDDTFVTVVKKNLYVFSASQMEEKKEGVEGDFSGMPCWDGGDRIALTYRFGKQIRMVDMSNAKNPSTLWVEDTCGYPETATFWCGKLAVPCGYQGLLIEK